MARFNSDRLKIVKGEPLSIHNTLARILTLRFLNSVTRCLRLTAIPWTSCIPLEPPGSPSQPVDLVYYLPYSGCSCSCSSCGIPMRPRPLQWLVTRRVPRNELQKSRNFSAFITCSILCWATVDMFQRKIRSVAIVAIPTRPRFRKYPVPCWMFPTSSCLTLLCCADAAGFPAYDLYTLSPVHRVKQPCIFLPAFLSTAITRVGKIRFTHNHNEYVSNVLCCVHEIAAPR